MSSRLCTACKSVHKRPWDDRCKSVTSEQLLDKNQPDMASQSTATSPQGTNKGDPGNELLGVYQKLLNTVEGISTQVKAMRGVSTN